ncbi:uncharacterized protein BCR38DRAFT_481411 [Pseudomassariella vexata]|uniref:Uncharacterized protein n=1 Tax=Pseudomassariella vexata TaxID=1141098 RepID=A0A1Y2EHM0_9PEZI|nr:uncharacterized protein BCR38DRAFT_481411 [Pseudomassariella vexata]ORY70275.1 hypothetical protein BCR38DRAFT_481411 [Pseudomassariella vexata]
MISSAAPRVARQVVGRRLFSTRTPLRAHHPSMTQELQSFFKSEPHQSANWSKMAKTRAVTFGIYATGMTTVLGWPYAAAWALDGKMGSGIW